jgi:ubiquitin-conjugating enzyme E2 A
MMNMTVNRLTRELKKINDENIPNITILPPENILIWYAKIYGPKDSPFENGVFDIKLSFDNDYPVKPPSVKFLSKMFHPNIYRDGFICIDILQSEWSPAQNVRTILLSILSLLTDPNPSSPANSDASKLFMNDYTEYCKRVKELLI